MRAGERPITKEQRETLEALRRLRTRGMTPATAVEIAREAGYRNSSRVDSRTADGRSTVNASTRVQAPLSALVRHGLARRVDYRRGGGRGHAYEVAPNPEDFARFVAGLEDDLERARKITLRQLVSAAKESLGE